MAIFQPSYVIPDVRSGIGLGVVDATQSMTVSWRINGPSALTKFRIVIYRNNSASTQLFSTGAITTGCPAYGTNSTGEISFFSYTISAASLASAGITNGNEYKLVITQWWSASDSVTQSSASVFVTRAAPTLSIADIGTEGVIATRYYTFTGNYAQGSGDVLNWFRWRIAYADDTENPFYDSENISGTMDISCTYDGFFDATDYAVRLTVQTESGVEADTGWVNFSASYDSPEITGRVIASCASGTDAVLVEWPGIAYIEGEATGTYSISADYLLTLSAGASVLWDEVNGRSLSFSAPWGVVWKGTLGAQSVSALFTIGQGGGDIVLSYAAATGTLTLRKGGAALASQSGVPGTATVTAVLTQDTLYLRCDYLGGGLYPSTSLTPSASLYPRGDTHAMTDLTSHALSYTQETVTRVTVGGYQVCDFLEVINGSVSAETITAAWTDGDYEPGLSEEDYLLANWQNGINAGNLNIGDNTIEGFAIYRRRGTGGILNHVADVGVKVAALYDYAPTSQRGPYTYYLFPIGTESYISLPVISDEVSPCWWNWTLMECAETDTKGCYAVLAAYRFRYNLESGETKNNNVPSVLKNFTPYPTVQLAPQNYKSGTLTGLIGAISAVNGQPRYTDTITLRDAIFALSVSQNALFLKNRKGDLLRIRVSEAISMTTDDKTREQAQTMKLPWVEIGSAERASLYATENMGVSP